MNWKINIAGNQRNLIYLKKLDICPLLENVDTIPIPLKYEADFLKETFHGMVHKCPYTVSVSNSRQEEICSRLTFTVYRLHQCFYNSAQEQSTMAMVPERSV